MRGKTWQGLVCRASAVGLSAFLGACRGAPSPGEEAPTPTIPASSASTAPTGTSPFPSPIDAPADAAREAATDAAVEADASVGTGLPDAWLMNWAAGRGWMPIGSCTRDSPNCGRCRAGARSTRG